MLSVEPTYREARPTGENPFLPDDLHPSAKGMGIAANGLYEAIPRAGCLEPDKEMAS